MKKTFTILIAALMLVTMITKPNNVAAQTAAVGTELWKEPFKGTNTSTSFSATNSWGNYTNPTTFVAADASSLSYSSSNAMLSSTSSTNMNGAHVWLNKSVDGYIQVTGIPLYNATKVKVLWKQATSGSSTTVYYQFDGTGDFVSLSTCSGPNPGFESTELSVANHTTIALKFFHPSSNTKNTRIDDLILQVTEIAAPSGTTAAPTISGNNPFLTNTTVTITNDESATGANIYYTLNGDAPTTTTTATCFEYSAPFQISATTTVKAIAKKSTDTNASSVVDMTFTKVTPMTVSAALEAISALENNGTIANQCVNGIVCTAGSLNNGAITYYISADGTATNRLQVYKGKGLYNANFTAATDIAVGDEVVVYGTLKKYVSGNTTTPEFDAGSYLLSKVSNPAVVTSVTELTGFTYQHNAGPSTNKSFNVSGSNLVENITVSLTSGSDRYEMSTTGENDTWQTSDITISKGEGSVSATPIYVRLKSGLSINASYSGIITVSTGELSKTVSLSGSVTGYTVTYNGNGSDGGTTPNDANAYAYNAEVTAAANTFSKTGYDFSTWNSAAEGNGSITVGAGSKFNITANTTLYAQWTPISYAITKSIGANGSVTVKVNNTEVTSAQTGSTVTLVITPNSGYALDELTVTQTGGSGEVELSGNTFTMPSYAVTVTASFKVAHNLTFYVNGTLKEIRAVEDGDQIGTLPTVTPQETPNGFALVGWIAGNDYFNATIAPASYISATDIPTGDATYTAVFAQICDGDLVTGELSATEIADQFASGGHAYAGGEVTYTDNSDNITWSAKYSANDTRHWIQLKSDNDVYIKIVTQNNIRKVTLTISNASNSSGGVDDITKHGAFSSDGSIYLNTSKGSSTHAGSVSGSSVVNNVVSIEPSGNNTTLYLQVNSAARIWGITVKHAPTAYKNYTTIITDENVSSNVSTNETLRIFGNISATAAVTNSGTIHIFDGGVLDMGTYQLTNEIAANLIIEDGGQLIVPNNATPVSATVQKTIVAPTGTWGQNDNSGWYAISSTVGSIANNSLSSVTNLVPAPVNQVTQFDLYKYVEGSGWLNYAAHTQDFGGLANGHGYLYANKNGATLSFAGNITTSDVVLSNLSATSSNNNLKGIHLIGNPYTHNIYKSVAIEASEGTLSTGYYKLDGSNLWVAESDATPIAPGQGFLVKVTDGTTLTLHNTANSTRANNDYIRFAVANSQYEDATFAMFKEGKGLTKINHRNAEAPMIYINQDNANYAIATMSDATESFSLNFKAMTTGQYTLSFTTQGEFNYLHVIDRLTGADIDMLLEGEYKFIGTPNDSDNRFIVRLAYLPDYGEENGIFAYQSGNEIFVSGEGELQIFDVTGRYVMSERINGVNTINADALSKGVYVLRIIGSEIKTQKIVVR